MHQEGNLKASHEIERSLLKLNYLIQVPGEATTGPIFH